ncbi:MAG: glycerol-3-phosphate dehydrogenase [Massilia sp.]|nr:glycerol-3-phosphate dehydrogenase [Massilia sp.]
MAGAVKRFDGSFDCDVLIVGGGINGAAIARDAAGRGLRVVLCEKDDLAGHTSSASSKLIHGGLRYLEHYEFGLVRKALIERETLLRCAPHIMRPLRFVMPHEAGKGPGARPAWLIRAGLFLYDRLARREFLPASHAVDLRCHPAGAPLQPRFTRGFMYSDGWVDDARLVVLNALDARERGATVLTRTRCAPPQRHPGGWSAALDGKGRRLHVTARCLVNAAGPWAARFLDGATSATNAMTNATPGTRTLRLIKGSHIVVPRLFEHPHAYIFQHPDGRIVFALPYESAFTLIGTTDIDYRGDLDRVAISAEETAYLCQLANRYFVQRITPADVVWSYSGVRPLVEDSAAHASAATRDYRLELDASGGSGAPLLSVFGGKITTSRKLAEDAVDLVGAALGHRAPAWTAKACLPGGDLFGASPSKRGVLEFGSWMARQAARHPWLPPQLLARYGRAYGTRIDTLLAGSGKLADLGRELAPGLYEAEVRYLMHHEWACSADDILWRRTKLGLHVAPGSAAVLDDWIAARQPALVP